MIGKWKILMLIPVLALACAWPGLAPAATLDYSASGFYSFARAYVVNSIGDTGDSGELAQWRETDAHIHAWADTERYCSSDIVSKGQQTSDASNHQHVLVSVAATGSLEDTGSCCIDTYGHADTIDQERTTSGVYFIINPSEGEEIGDAVILSWDWSAEAKTGHHSSATLTGGHSDDIAITLLSGSDPAVTIWSYSQQSLSSNDNFTDTASGQILVHIGDIIGVHLGASVDIYKFYTDEVNFHASSEQVINLYVQAVPIPGTVWLLGSGLLGLAGLRLRRKS